MIEKIVAIICFVIDRFFKYDVMYGKKFFITGSIGKLLHDALVYFFDFVYTNKFAVYVIFIGILLSILFLFSSMQKKQMPGVYLLSAGGLSNLIDRFWYGIIIDYMQLSCFPVRFPLFNISDILIISGAAMILFAMLKRN